MYKALNSSRRRFISQILFMMLAATLHAAPYSFKSYMTVDGLSDNRVLCALQDSYGFMWIGTANGLNCFDGRRNVVYRNMVGGGMAFENNMITSLFEHDGDIWLGGDFGLYVYHRQGEPCRECGVLIEYTKVAGRGTHYCPMCQRWEP